METINKYEFFNPYASDVKKVKVKFLPIEFHNLVKEFPNFNKNGNITGMKNLYYGKGALLVKCGGYIYNVTSKPEIYFDFAY